MRVLRIVALSLASLAILLAGCSSGPESTQVTFQVDTAAYTAWPEAQAERLALMDQTKTMTKERLSEHGGLDSATVTLLGDDKLVLFLKGLTGPQEVASIVSSITFQADMKFYHLRHVQNPKNPNAEWKVTPGDGDTETYVFHGPGGEVVNSASQPDEVMRLVVRPKENPPVLTGQDILPNAKASYNHRQQPVVIIEFNRQGAAIFRDFTENHINEHLAVFFDGKLLTAPTITEAIPDGQAEICGFANLKEARKAAQVINAGAQRLPLKVIKQEVVK